MLHYLTDLFFPKVCLGCSALLLANEKTICTHCRHEIPITHHHCIPNNEAFQKFYGKVPVEFAAALVYYHKKGIVQELIHNLKYKGHEEIGSALAWWFADELKSVSVFHEIDEIIPVPLHPKKLRQRGYNQVTTFGQCLSEALNIDYNPSLLLRNVYSKTQTKKDRANRSEVNKQSIFSAAYSEKNQGRHFLLIDDVLTTGSTLEACCKALLEIPGAKISILCMAMSH